MSRSSFQLFITSLILGITKTFRSCDIDILQHPYLSQFLVFNKRQDTITSVHPFLGLDIMWSILKNFK